jgi:uncharacterized protein YndB with AHSA1/START domain
VPTHGARRTLLAARDDVWAFLAEPHHLADWWPGIAAVRPDGRGLAAGARWEVVGASRPGLVRRPQSSALLLVRDVRPRERIAFHLTGERLDVELELHVREPNRTGVELTVSGPWLLGGRRRLPERALARLHALVQTGAEE